MLRRNGFKVYMFPELGGEEDGDSVGLLLHSAPAEELEELDHVSQEYATTDRPFVLLQMFAVLADFKITEDSHADTRSPTSNVGSVTAGSSVGPPRPPPPQHKGGEEKAKEEEEEHTWGSAVAGVSAGELITVHC